jgi:hypothetical protein
MYSVDQKNMPRKTKLPPNTSAFCVIPLFKIDQAQRHQHWTFDVGCSMFDVLLFYANRPTTLLLPK